MCLNMGAHVYVWSGLLKSLQFYVIFFKHIVIYSSVLISQNITIPVVILRCGGHPHHSGVGCHLHSSCRRDRYKSLCQVQIVNTSIPLSISMFTTNIESRIFFTRQDALHKCCEIGRLRKWSPSVLVSTDIMSNKYPE